jgi:hypothetical protein
MQNGTRTSISLVRQTVLSADESHEGASGEGHPTSKPNHHPQPIEGSELGMQQTYDRSHMYSLKNIMFLRSSMPRCTNCSKSNTPSLLTDAEGWLAGLTGMAGLGWLGWAG